MPKVTGPLFSVEAHKQLGKALTYQRRPGGASVYGYKKPKVPLTDEQIWQREKIGLLVHWWQSLSDADKALWEARAKGQRQSGYSYFISQQKNWMLDPSIALYLPLWSKSLKGDNFDSKDAYGHTCDVTGATWTALGRDFDSLDDEIDCGDGASLNITSALTLEAWIKTSDAGLSPVVGKWRSFAGKRAYELVSQANLLRLLISGDGDLIVIAQSAAAVNDGLPHHIVGVYDGVDMKTYIEGLEDTDSVSGAVPESINVTTQEVEVGNDGNGFMDGLIGETRIYNRALTPTEILNNYNATKWRY